eukprot:TRINITY_DN634_c1_g1_i1.p1 TRINITY_DN634_c1_g1~~TRINITY_DN634_c1_g1_i1.p1  ORF type:complete len:667 (-),score=49.33 TRINITY_DN634_c1_g1_i1:31-2031(-)
MATLYQDDASGSVSSDRSFSDEDDDSDYYSESKPEVPILDSTQSTITSADKSDCKSRDITSKIGIKRTQCRISNDDFVKPISKRKKVNLGGSSSQIDYIEPIWKWWEEDPLPKGVKWRTLQHEGPLFPPPYETLPVSVKLLYNKHPIKLSPVSEEIAGFYSKMLDHDYTKSEIFNKNFFHDWRKYMTKDESSKITKLDLCDFSQIYQHFKLLSEQRKSLSKSEKEQLKIENSSLQEKFGFCMIDGHRQKVGNYRIEPPGLFRGRGDHPKQGRLKLRTQAEDVIINIGKDANIPCPPPSHRWKKVQHDPTVTWLACWIENISGSYKYIMLNQTSRLKGEKDWQKYETARRLKKLVSHIREDYLDGLKSREMFIRQRSVAIYLIDRLALRAGNEKDSDEEADTVGCCSLRVEHIELFDEIDGSNNVVEFDFLGKDSIRYQNRVPIDKQVFKNLRLFMKNKEPDDDLFDRLSTSILNKYLHDLMDGLTAKVFRTYNASSTLQSQLGEFNSPNYSSIHELLLVYNRANRAVALLCNHQRAIPKCFDKQMDNIQKKINEKEIEISALRKEYKNYKKTMKKSDNISNKSELKKLDHKINALEEQLHKLRIQATDKEENKKIALGTSKLNYLDPRITVAWCKKFSVPIEKIYNKTQREKFLWAIDMTDSTFEF